MKAKIYLIDFKEPKDYEECFKLQKTLLERSEKEGIGFLLLLEHTPVFTLGRRAKKEHILAPEEVLKREGIKVVFTDRGGDVTYHGPGQLILYPIIPLDCSVKEYVWKLEEAIIMVLKKYDIKAIHRDGYPGVWIDERRKIASIGIGIKRSGKKWISYHGTAFNVDPILRHFLLITPCGLTGINMVSIKSLKGFAPPISEVKQHYLESFKLLFPSYEILNEDEMI
ncbi:MAG: lipoyl(octanoyl) transferase [bacterium]|nr:lipoyl(octanoyl) transferase [bacterium]